MMYRCTHVNFILIYHHLGWNKENNMQAEASASFSFFLFSKYHCKKKNVRTKYVTSIEYINLLSSFVACRLRSRILLTKKAAEINLRAMLLGLWVTYNFNGYKSSAAGVQLTLTLHLILFKIGARRREA